MIDDVKWLKSCPCGDGNFKIHLKNATTDELIQLADGLPLEGNKTKIKVIKLEIKRRVTK